MLKKKCNKCLVEYPESIEFFQKDKLSKNGMRSSCKVCARKIAKEYKSRPDVKEKHRVRQAEWRAKNPEKQIEISRKTYKKNSESNNEKRRLRYKTDEEYRNKKKEIDRLYSESGRRYEVAQKPESIEKSRIRSKKRRKDPTKKEHDYKRNSKWREDNKEYVLGTDKNRRENLVPSYIATTMRVSVKDLTPEIIETKRNIIKLKRELKKKQRKN